MWFVGHLVHEAPTATLLCADMCRRSRLLGLTEEQGTLPPQMSRSNLGTSQRMH